MAIDSMVVQRIFQVLPPHGSMHPLTAHEVYNRLGNLRGRTDKNQVSRFLDRNTHKVVNSSGSPITKRGNAHMYTKPRVLVSETQVERESAFIRLTAPKD